MYGSIPRAKPSFEVQWRQLMNYERIKLNADPMWWLRWGFAMERYRSRHWFLSLLNECCGVLEMATSKKKGAGTTAGKPQWTTFVDISIAGVEWTDIQQVYGKGDDFTNALADLIGEGYRVAFSYNPANDAVICAVTGKEGCGANEGKTFNSFAGDWVTAAMVCLYKHNVVTNGDWSGAAGTPNRPSFG